MSGATSEYVTDVPYVRQLCRELAPPMLRAVAALEGYAPPPGGEFDYCEVGSGPGDTLCTLAAAHPRARFVGIDLNPEHVAFARGLAARGGLLNVRFLEGDFEALGGADLPPFDYVTALGLLTWISPEKQQAFVAFAASRLAPGGLLYVGYDAMPGWAALEPLRRLMLDAGGTEGTTADRARRGLEAARALRERGASYFVTNPSAAEMLATVERHGLPYLVHEYFHAHWRPMHFADMASRMGAAGLRFVGQLPLYRNVPELALPQAMADLAAAARDRIELERLSDYAENRFFRGDVYRKGDGRPSPAATLEYVDATRFGTLVPAERVPREVRLPHHVLRFEGDLFDAIVPRLAARAASARELVEDPALAPFGANRVRGALLRLLAGDAIVPMRADPDGPATLYNRAILEQPIAEKSPVILAAPAAGTGVQVPALAAVCLRLLTWMPPEERAGWIRAFVARQPLRLQVRGEAVADPEDQARVLEREVERFRVGSLPKLVGLGVVQD